jgi:hypothetical protein
MFYNFNRKRFLSKLSLTLKWRLQSSNLGIGQLEKKNPIRFFAFFCTYQQHAKKMFTERKPCTHNYIFLSVTFQGIGGKHPLPSELPSDYEGNAEHGPPARLRYLQRLKIMRNFILPDVCVTSVRVRGLCAAHPTSRGQVLACVCIFAHVFGCLSLRIPVS